MSKMFKNSVFPAKRTEPITNNKEQLVNAFLVNNHCSFSANKKPINTPRAEYKVTEH
jgi:hypothetical protein